MAILANREEPGNLRDAAFRAHPRERNLGRTGATCSRDDERSRCRDNGATLLCENDQALMVDPTTPRGVPDLPGLVCRVDGEGESDWACTSGAGCRRPGCPAPFSQTTMPRQGHLSFEIEGGTGVVFYSNDWINLSADDEATLTRTERYNDLKQSITMSATGTENVTWTRYGDLRGESSYTQTADGSNAFTYSGNVDDSRGADRLGEEADPGNLDGESAFGQFERERGDPRRLQQGGDGRADSGL